MTPSEIVSLLARCYAAPQPLPSCRLWIRVGTDPVFIGDVGDAAVSFEIEPSDDDGARSQPDRIVRAALAWHWTDGGQARRLHDALRSVGAIGVALESSNRTILVAEHCRPDSRFSNAVICYPTNGQPPVVFTTLRFDPFQMAARS